MPIQQDILQPEVRELADPGRDAFREPGRPRPVRAYVWSPAQERPDPPPVVLVSHGTGGSAGEMEWLIRPLAAAGFLTVAVDHHGNNVVDGYLPEGFAFVSERPRDLTFVLDTLAAERPLGPVGAAGFSAGGYTAAALLGARVDPAVLEAVLSGGAPLPPLPEYPDVVTALLEAVPGEEVARRIHESGADLADPRIRAAFQVCPAIAPLLDVASLAAIDRPVEIRWADADVIASPAENAFTYLRTIPTAAGRSAGPAGHHHFFNDDPDGGPVRAAVAADAVRFFRTHLR